MSTRCQIQVIEDGGSSLYDSVTLYHHRDSYPEKIIPEILKASKLAGTSYLKGMAGKVASFLCAVVKDLKDPAIVSDDHQGNQLFLFLR